jgi:ATP-dependent DNA helicase RecG
VEDLDALVEQLRIGGGDTSGVEVKSAAGGLPTTLTHSLSALTNLPGGGLIILGLDERAGFTPVGLANVQGLKQGLAGEARALTPPAQLSISDEVVDGHPVVVARVAECAKADKPCRVTSTRKAYLRGHDGDYQLSELEEQGFLLSREAPSADRQVVPGTGVADLDPALIKAWSDQVRARRPALSAFSGDDLLHKAGILAATGELTRAGLLALGSYPQEYLPQLVVRAADLRDPDSRVRAKNITTLDGPIPTLLTATMAWLRANLPTAVVESPGGSVRNVPQFPLEALRELVANALVHRDLSPWSEGMAVELRLERDGLVLTNPGGLYGITVDRLGSDHVTSARNGRLVALCENAVDPHDGSRVIEALASGLPRVTRSLEDAALPPARFFDVGLRFTVVLSTGRLGVRRTKDVPLADKAASVAEVRGLRPGSQLATVYQSLVDHGRQTVVDLAGATGIPGPSVRRALTRLRDDYGYVESLGGRGRRTTYTAVIRVRAVAK